MDRRRWTVAAGTAVAVLLFSSPALAATITVNTTAELLSDGNCSLREAPQVIEPRSARAITWR